MKVSVVIPTYSRAPLLCEAIDSVLSQDLDDMELIVIDDGSTDDTEERARAYGDRIRYYRQENKGLSTARNRGIELANGEYIALLDDDDWFMPGKLRLQAALLDAQPGLSGTFSNFTIYRDDDDITPGGIQTWYNPPMEWSRVFDRTVTLADLVSDTHPLPPETPAYIGSLYDASLEHYFVLPTTSLFRKSMMPEDGLFPLNDPICGDWDFFARLGRRSPICFVDGDLSFNRSHVDEQRLTRTRMRRQMSLRVDFLERVYLKDANFYRNNKARVDRLLGRRLAELCKLELLDGDQAAARETAMKLLGVGGQRSPRERLVAAIARIPAAATGVKLARKLKRRLGL